MVLFSILMAPLVLTVSLWGFETIWSHGGTLVIIGVTRQGITLASDGLSQNDNGSAIKRVRKIVPFGRFGAVALLGKTKVEARKGRAIRGQVDIAEITKKWSSNHPSTNVRTGNTSLNRTIVASLTDFFSIYKPSSALPKQPFFNTIVSGYSGSKPVVFMNMFYAPNTWGKPVKVETVSCEPAFGSLLRFGLPRVCNELIEDTSDGLRKYKSEPIMELFRERKRLSQGSKGTLAEFLSVSNVCLRATESKEGQMFDPKSFHVGPPYSFATITLDYGFRWETQP